MDTSAVIAILTGEPGGDALAEALESATPRLIPAPALVELGIVLEARYGPRAGRWSSASLVPPNLCDCFSSGLASTTGYPVLCVAEDFAATDVEVIRPRV